MPRFIPALIAPLLAWLTIFPASACVVTSDYVAPSNFELVQMADAIGVYTALSGSKPADYPFGNVIFRLERSVHGAPPPKLSLDFAQLHERDASFSESIDFEQPFEFHNYGSGCTAGGFSRDGAYLLILHRNEKGDWERVHYGGSRASEPYGGETFAWARTVRRYVELQALEPAAQQSALRALRDDGRNRDGTPLSRLERIDIENHLRTPSQWKPTSWLVERYEQAVRGEAVDVLLTGPINWGGKIGQDPRATLLTSLAKGSHDDARPLFERLLASASLTGRERGLTLLYFARHGEYPLAFRWIEFRLLTELPKLPDKDALSLLSLVQDVVRGDSDEEGAERWRSDPRSAAVWPQLEPLVSRYEERLRDAD